VWTWLSPFHGIGEGTAFGDQEPFLKERFLELQRTFRKYDLINSLFEFWGILKPFSETAFGIQKPFLQEGSWSSKELSVNFVL
jgi:hypothetical protein